MSHQATTWVMEFSEARLADRLVLGAIAHRISNDDGDAWPSIKRIMHESRLSERQVYESLKTLVLMGEIFIREEPSERGTNRYHMPKFLTWVQTLHPAQSAPPAKSAKCTLHNLQNAGAQNADEPSIEPSVEQPSAEICPEHNCLKSLCKGQHKPKRPGKQRNAKYSAVFNTPNREYVQFKTPLERRREDDQRRRENNNAAAKRFMERMSKQGT